jgi:pimeloyl-ACP methyl ester carboxylesterase
VEVALSTVTSCVVRVVLVATVAAICAVSAAGRATTATTFVLVGGHRMYYECSGRGSPTVVLDAGSPDTTAAWRYVQPQIARYTHVCSYDRRGVGRSAPAPAGKRTPLNQVHDLAGLLAAAKIAGPYVLAGHSWGGFLARLFAWTYPQKTAGVVLVDATTFPYLTPATARRVPRKTTVEGIDVAAAVSESAAITTLGDLPLIVLGSNKPPLSAKLLQAQEAEAALSTDSIDATALHSTHYIQFPPPTGQPQLVVTAIDAVVTASRSHRNLPSCRRLFAASAAECRPR